MHLLKMILNIKYQFDIQLNVKFQCHNFKCNVCEKRCLNILQCGENGEMLGLLYFKASYVICQYYKSYNIMHGLCEIRKTYEVQLCSNHVD